MNRRSFFARLALGIAVLPAAIKAIGKKDTLYFDGENSYLKTTSFKMEPCTIYFVPGVSGNYTTAPDWPPAQMEGDVDWVIVMEPAKSC